MKAKINTNNRSYSPEKKTTINKIDKKFDVPFVSFIPHEHLRHHIILPIKVLNQIQSIEKEYAAKDRLGKYNLEPKKKILLYGHIGCGKSLSANYIAWNLGLPILKVAFDALLSSNFNKYLPVIREIFNYSEKESIVLLLNDIGEGLHIKILLALLEEYKPKGLIFATSNITEKDKFLFSHFDDVIRIPIPEIEESECLLKMILSSVTVYIDVDFHILADQMRGCSYADIVLITQNAIKKSILDDSKSVGKSHFEEAIVEHSKF